MSNLLDYTEQVINHYHTGKARGKEIGFRCLNEFMTFKPKYTTYILGFPRAGKCLAKGTKVIMADATLKKVEDVVIGDKLIGINGSIRTVTNLGRGQEQMYRINQQMGISYEVNESHILSLKLKRNLYGRYKTLPEHNKRGTILNISVKDYLNMKPTMRPLYKGWRSECNFYAQSVPIDPYFLGVWLGDGSSTGVTITNVDKEIIDYIGEYAEMLGGIMSVYDYKDRTAGYGITSQKGKTRGILKDKLRELDVYGNKHIPHIYINNSKKNRLELLAGLIDTDGSLDKNGSCFEIIQKNETLAKQIKYLADTLGFRTSINTKKATMNRADSKDQYTCEVFRVRICGNISQIPTKVKRKQAVYKESLNERFTAISVEPIGLGEYYGFTLDGDGLFLLEDGTVTHNTEFHLEILFNLTEKYGWKHALMSPEIGGIEDVVAELVSKHLRRQFFKNSYNAPTEKEIHQAMNHLSQYFYPKDADENEYTVESFYEDCKKTEVDNKIKLNTTSIDPWNDLDEDLGSFGGREDKYLAWALRKVRSTAKTNNWHNFIVTHAKDIPNIELKSVDGGKVVCTGIPTLQAFAGGQVWSRRGYNVIGLWKPEKGAINKRTGEPYEDNEAMIKMLKSKPKGSGSLGMAYLFYDWKMNRYYEVIDGKNYYSFEHEHIPPPAEIHTLVDQKVTEKAVQVDLF